MGQKVSPHGLRVGIIKDWDSRWYANKKNMPALIMEDHMIRDYINKNYYSAGISRIYIDRIGTDKITINIFTSKPGMIVGKGGETIKLIRSDLEKKTNKKVHIDVSEVQNINSDAKLLAMSITESLERRISFRRALKQAISNALKAGVKGVKVQVSGRLGGADMARTEGYSEGNVPLSTLRADIDYGFVEADTTYGKLGVKVWLYKGEVLSKPNEGKVLKRQEPKQRTSNRGQSKKKRPRRDKRQSRRNTN